MLIREFSLTTDNKNLEILMNTFDLECLIKKLICFQSENPLCVDLTQGFGVYLPNPCLILTNKTKIFEHSGVIQVRISNHHSFVVTSLKSELVKGKVKAKKYGDYSKYNMDAFKEDLDKSLRIRKAYEYTHFQNTFGHTLYKYAPIREKNT